MVGFSVLWLHLRAAAATTAQIWREIVSRKEKEIIVVNLGAG